MIKKFFNKLKNGWSWHFFPNPNELNLKSAVEFLFYLIITILLLFVFYYWHKVPERNVVLCIDKIHSNHIVPKDSSVLFSADICLNIPMTNRESEDNCGLKYDLTYNNSEISKSKYDSIIGNRKDCILHYPNKNDSLLYEKVRPSNHLSKLADFLKSHSDLGNKNVFYYAYGYNTSFLNSYASKPTTRYKANKYFDCEDSCHIFSYIESTRYYFCRCEFYMVDDSNLAFLASSPRGELGGPIWYRFEDISQSYYNVRIVSSSMDSLTLKLDFRGVVDFSNMIPEPDIKGMGFIEFHDQAKLRQIESNGLQFHAKFKELENMQTVRLLGVTTVLGGIIIIFVAIFFIGLYHFMKWTKKHVIKGVIIIVVVFLLLFYYFHLFDPIINP